jgi:hypothetical protein
VDSFAVKITELSMQYSSGSSATDTEKVAPSGDAAVSSLDQQLTWSSVVDVAVDFPGSFSLTTSSLVSKRCD